MRAMNKAELGVEIDVLMDLACDAPAEVVADFILARVKEMPVDRKAPVKAVPPPRFEKDCRPTRESPSKNPAFPFGDKTLGQTRCSRPRRG